MERFSETGIMKGDFWRKIKTINRKMAWLKMVLVAMLMAGIVVGGVFYHLEKQNRLEEERILQQRKIEQEKKAEIERKKLEEEAKMKAEIEAKKRAEAEQARLEAERIEKERRIAQIGQKIGGKKLVALTFDDGPSGATTPKLLQILRDKKVKVTFFVLGRMMQAYPEVVKWEVADGHEVQGHTMYHSDLTKLNEAQIRADIGESDELFRRVLGRTPEMIRPPYGAMNALARQVIARPLMYWSVDALDWKYRNVKTVQKNVLSAVFSGAVVLMHDIHQTTVDAVGGIIDVLRGDGYEFVTVSELAKAKGVSLRAGWDYWGV